MSIINTLNYQDGLFPLFFLHLGIHIYIALFYLFDKFVYQWIHMNKILHGLNSKCLISIIYDRIHFLSLFFWISLVLDLFLMHIDFDISLPNSTKTKPVDVLIVLHWIYRSILRELPSSDVLNILNHGYYSSFHFALF